MQGKITLITPPDFYENNNKSILLINITDKEQDIISKWLSTLDTYSDLNIYLYSGEPNIPWFFYAVNRCEYKYMNLSNINYITQWLTGYIMGKSNVFYTTDDENLVAILSHINGNHVTNVENFLEVAVKNENQ